MECFIFGALISPTDPIAVLEMLRRTGVPKHMQAQLAGESLFNDGIGAVLFITMLAVARGNATTPWHVAGLLVAKAGGAVPRRHRRSLHHIAIDAPARLLPGRHSLHHLTRIRRLRSGGYDAPLRAA